MLQQVLLIVFPVFSIILLGYLYGRKYRPDMADVNKMNMQIFTPALIFSVLSSKSFELSEYQNLAIAAAIVVLGSGLLAWPVSRLMGFNTKTFVPPTMFTNSGNMGLPLALFAFGESALPAAVILFIVENTLHFTVGMKMVDRHASILEIFKLPILISTLAGLFVAAFHIGIPILLARPIEMVGQVAIPLMLFSLGVRLLSVNLNDWRIGLAGAIVTPVSGLLMAILLLGMINIPQHQEALFMLFAVLPPAVLNFMVAEKFNQEPARVASIVILGNVMSIITVPAVLFFVL